MQTPIRRRGFLKYSLGSFGLLTLGRAIEPFKRAGSPRLMLSLAAYSFRQYFIHGGEKGKSGVDPAKRIDLFQFIDFCADHGCEATEPCGLLLSIERLLMEMDLHRPHRPPRHARNLSSAGTICYR